MAHSSNAGIGSFRTSAADADEGSATAEPPLELSAFECSLDTTSLDQLGEVARALPRAQVHAAFGRLPAVQELALLSTCHRVELYLIAERSRPTYDVRPALPGAPEVWREYRGAHAVRHLYRVAGGWESLAVGEREVGRQVRNAGGAVLSRHPRAVLRELFLGAADGAPVAPTALRGAPSVAAVAADHVARILPTESSRVVVVGTGVVGRQFLEHLPPRVAKTVVYRTRPPSDALLGATGAAVLPIERLDEAVRVADVLVLALRSDAPILGARDVPTDRPIVVVDLGMPRNVDPGVRRLANVRLVDLEELRSRRVSGVSLSAGDELEDRVGRAYDRLERKLWEPSVAEVYRAAEAIRRAEYARARKFLGRLDPAQEVAVERLTRRLVSQVLRGPVERARTLPAGTRGNRERQRALELIRPAPGDP